MTGTAAPPKVKSLASSTTAGSDAEYLANRYVQGGRVHYSLQIPLARIVQHLPKPDPAEPFDKNRAVDAKHATSFAGYLRDNPRWVSPAVMLRAAQGDIEEVSEPVGLPAQQTSLVNVRLPRKVTDRLAALEILDGQHRTLGVYEAFTALQTDIAEARRVIRMAEDQDLPQVAETARTNLASLEDVQRRFSEECISLDVAIVEDDGAHHMFVDIADNAKGISRDFRIVLDQRQVINRIATNLMDHHSLLRNRTWDGQRGRMPAKSPFLYGAKAIADITRAALKGPRGRVGRNDEQIYGEREEEYTREVGFFFDDLLGGFEVLRRIEAGTLEPSKLRETVGRGDAQLLGPEFSMLYSESMLRALAGAWNELQHPSPPPKAKKGNPEPVAPKPLTRPEIVKFFGDLEPLLHLTRPLTDRSPWVKQTSAFIPGGTAPQGSSGAVSSLSQRLVDWARSGVPTAA